jgi:hypothetical protein
MSFHQTRLKIREMDVLSTHAISDIPRSIYITIWNASICIYQPHTHTYALMIEATLSLATTVKEEISSVDHTETTCRARSLIPANKVFWKVYS